VSDLKDELSAAVEARRELDGEAEPAVIDAFVAKIERRLASSERALHAKREHQKEMVLGSMAISVPLFAIAAIFTGFGGVVAVLIALVVIAVISAR
jgi:hypothetical protein